MLKRRIFSFLLILSMLTGIVSAAGRYQLPYAIQVNRAMNTVTIYAPDENGAYTVPVKAMICSTGREGSETPTGTFYLIDYRSEWRLMLDGTYGQYATCFRGNFLFHSICYSDDSHDAMVREAYNNLGNAASMGCVRLQTKDAKWIFDNCPAGTQVTIYDDFDSPGPLGKPSKAVSEITEQMYNGWDPTDPAAGNPWCLDEVSYLSLSREILTMRAGASEKIGAFVTPSTAMVFWYSSNEAVATVDQSGRVTALSAGSVKITARGINGTYATSIVLVTDRLLPYEDVMPGAWYYPAVRYVVEEGLFSGVNETKFMPDGVVSRAMAVQVLYNLAGRPKVTERPAFDDVSPDAWYADAVAWAVQKGLISGLATSCFVPEEPVNRQTLVTLIWRYLGQPTKTAYLGIYSDAAEIAPEARKAFSWMIRNYLISGTNGALLPHKTATRAELASILYKLSQL